MSDVPIPERLKSRPLYRGYVVPYSVLVDDQGRADFRVTDMDKWSECAKLKLCALCGQKLDYWVWYIGGPSCAESGVYFDLALHEECCFYAAKVCPFLMGAREYSERPAKVAREGYRTEVREDVPVAMPSALYASKRRRDQLKIVNNGGQLAVKTGPEAERRQIWPKPPRPTAVVADLLNRR